MKKDRKRNLVPAKTGLLIIIFLCIYTFSFILAYAGDLAYSDAGTRNYFLSLTEDMLACVFAPGIIVFQAPTIRRKIKSIISTLFDISTLKMENLKKSLFVGFVICLIGLTIILSLVP